AAAKTIASLADGLADVASRFGTLGQTADRLNELASDSESGFRVASESFGTRAQALFAKLKSVSEVLESSTGSLGSASTSFGEQFARSAGTLQAALENGAQRLEQSFTQLAALLGHSEMTGADAPKPADTLRSFGR